MTLKPRAVRSAFVAIVEKALDAFVKSDVSAPEIDNCRAGLAVLAERMARPPCVAMIGEFNSGKSTLANALLKGIILPTSVLANTQKALHVRYSPAVALAWVTPNGERQGLDIDDDQAPAMDGPGWLELGLPFPQLQTFELLDSPPIVSFSDFLRWTPVSSHLIPIWCTVASQAWKDTERQIWAESPPRNRRHALLVATHLDALQDPIDVERVQRRLSQASIDLFQGVRLVSAVTALDRCTTAGAASDADATECGIQTLIADIMVQVTRIDHHRSATAARLALRLARMTHRIRDEALRKAAHMEAANIWRGVSDGLRTAVEAPGANLKSVALDIDDAIQSFALRDGQANGSAALPALAVNHTDASREAHRGPTALPTKAMLLHLLDGADARMAMFASLSPRRDGPPPACLQVLGTMIDELASLQAECGWQGSGFHGHVESQKSAHVATTEVAASLGTDWQQSPGPAHDDMGLAMVSLANVGEAR